jgi:hypothetical protein
MLRDQGNSIRRIAMATKKDTPVQQTNPDIDEKQTVSNVSDVSIADSFKGLSMCEPIGAPLHAAIEAQQQLVSATQDFIQKVTYKDKDGKEVHTQQFTFTRTVQQGETTTAVEQTLKVPVLGLVPIPALSIDAVNVNFQMEVKSTHVDKPSVSPDVFSKQTPIKSKNE